MKLTTIPVCICLMASSVQAQFWIVGDTTYYNVHVVDQLFLPDARISFDIDCDEVADYVIVSQRPLDAYYPWVHLNLGMAEDVELQNDYSSFITLFDGGDTITLEDTLWTNQLGFIYGTGEMGSYGHYEINDKFIALRKLGQDTVYSLLRLSTQLIEFTIHEVLSVCAQPPLEVMTSPTSSVQEEPWIHVYPNPVSDNVYIEGFYHSAELISDLGRKVYSQDFCSHEIDLSQFSPGTYWLRLYDGVHVHTTKLIKVP